MPSQIKLEKCTNCGSDQIEVAGNKFFCRVCNIVFEVTDTGTKVLDANPLDKFEQRQTRLERAFEALERAGQGGDEPDHVDQVDTPDLQEGLHNDEDETEENGFIVFE